MHIDPSVVLIWDCCGKYGYTIPWAEWKAGSLWPIGATFDPKQPFLFLYSQRGQENPLLPQAMCHTHMHSAGGCYHSLCIDAYLSPDGLTVDWRAVRKAILHAKWDRFGLAINRDDDTPSEPGWYTVLYCYEEPGDYATVSLWNGEQWWVPLQAGCVTCGHIGPFTHDGDAHAAADWYEHKTHTPPLEFVNPYQTTYAAQPSAAIVVPPAHFVDSDDCQGHSQRYWRTFVKTSDGDTVCGTGATAAEAEQAARSLAQRREHGLSSSLREQLLLLVSKENMSPRDVERAVKLLAKLLPGGRFE